MDLAALLQQIEERPNYIDHFVLDAGLKVVAVNTTKGFYIYDGRKPKGACWQQVTIAQLTTAFKSFWFELHAARFIKGKQCQ